MEGAILKLHHWYLMYKIQKIALFNNEAVFTVEKIYIYRENIYRNRFVKILTEWYNFSAIYWNLQRTRQLAFHSSNDLKMGLICVFLVSFILSILFCIWKNIDIFADVVGSRSWQWISPYWVLFPQMRKSDRYFKCSKCVTQILTCGTEVWPCNSVHNNGRYKPTKGPATVRVNY